MKLDKNDQQILNQNIESINIIDLEALNSWNIEIHFSDPNGTVLLSLYDLDTTLWEVVNSNIQIESINEPTTY